MRFARRATIVVVLIAACAAAALVSGSRDRRRKRHRERVRLVPTWHKGRPGEARHLPAVRQHALQARRRRRRVGSRADAASPELPQGQRHAPHERPHDSDLAHRGRDPVVADRALPGPHRPDRLELATTTTRRPASRRSRRRSSTGRTSPSTRRTTPLPNMVSDGGQTAPAPWLTYTHAGCNVGGVSAANIELENNTSIAITSLSAASLVSDTTIKVGVGRSDGARTGPDDRHRRGDARPRRSRVSARPARPEPVSR